MTKKHCEDCCGNEIVVVGAALIRFDNKRGITVFPPSMTGDTFREYANSELRPEHTFRERVAAISTAPKIVPPR